MPLVYACIAPHSGAIIEELAGDLLEPFAPTRAAMLELGRRMEAAAPDIIVVITPHGVRVEDEMCLAVTERADGMLEEGEQRVVVDMEVDIALTRAMIRRAHELFVPCAAAGYGASSGPGCSFIMDWGALIPLWFMGARWEQPPRIVLVCPSRTLPFESLVRFGEAFAEVATASDQRIALIASSDLGHAHNADGPYGYDPASAEFDQQVVAAVEADDLRRLLDYETERDFLAHAKPDGLWQMLSLYGATRIVPMRGEFLSYQAPTYFGMLCASYTPTAAMSREP
jgi:aromatic ring-opening dioxygenase LigB subunit